LNRTVLFAFLRAAFHTQRIRGKKIIGSCWHPGDFADPRDLGLCNQNEAMQTRAEYAYVANDANFYYRRTNKRLNILREKLSVLY
jgi:hypothetical protein